MHWDYQFLFVLCFRCLKYSIKICFINLKFSNFFHELFTTLPCFFSFYEYMLFWILLNKTSFYWNKIYVKNDFKAANTTFLSSKLWYHFLTMELSIKVMKNQGENKNRNNISTWASREKCRILCHFPFHLELTTLQHITPRYINKLD